MLQAPEAPPAAPRRGLPPTLSRNGRLASDRGRPLPDPAARPGRLDGPLASCPRRCVVASGAPLIRCSLAAAPRQRQRDGDVGRDRELDVAHVRAVALDREGRLPELAVVGRPGFVLELGESARRRLEPVPSVSVGRTNLRPRRPNQRPESIQLIDPSGLEPLNLEGDAPRAAFWLDSLRHQSVHTPDRRIGTHAGASLQARPWGHAAAKPRRGPAPWRRYAPRRTRAARDFLRAPVLRCSAPRLTALSIVATSSRCSVSAVASSPAATARSRRWK